MGWICKTLKKLCEIGFYTQIPTNLQKNNLKQNIQTNGAALARLDKTWIFRANFVILILWKKLRKKALKLVFHLMNRAIGHSVSLVQGG